MNYRRIIIPFLANAGIKKKAELFRKKFWDNFIPVDIEKILELQLQLDIIPVPNLQKLCDTDALITSNWQAVYIDNDKYLDERYRNRLRFSLAHETGHFILHKDIYASFGIKDFDDFYRLLEEIPQEAYDRLEIQANKFANYLLVPRERLLIEKKEQLQKIDKQLDLTKIDKATLNAYMAVPISKVFGISDSVVEIALNEIDNLR